MDARQIDYRQVTAGAEASAAAAMAKANSADTKASAADQKAASAQTTATAAEQLAKLSRIDFGLLTVNFQAVAAIAVGPQTVTFDVPAAKAGDRVTIYPVTFPPGYAALGNGYSTANGKVSMQVLRPVLGALVNVSFTVRAIAYRDAPGT